MDNNNYHTRWIVDGLQFQMDGNFVNLARIDPSQLVAVKSGAKGHHICEMFTAWSKINWICNVYWMTNMLWVSHLSPCRHGIWQKDVGELGSRHGGFQCTAIWRVPAWSTLPEIQHPNLQLLCLVPMTLFPNCQCVLGIGFWDDGAGVESVWYWGQEWHWI